MADETPVNRSLTLVTKTPLTIDSPDSTTIEVVAAATGAKGTRFNFRSDFTVDGSPPSIDPADPPSGYTMGEEQKYQVLPPTKIAIGGVPIRPYTIKMLVEASNVVSPDDVVLANFDIVLSASTEHITGLAPSIIVNKTKIQLTLTSQATTIDAGKTVVTSTYIADIAVNDPIPFQVLARILGPPGSQGKAQVLKVVTTEPDPPPTLPGYGATPEGLLRVGDEFDVFGPDRGRDFREEFTARKLYAKIRAIDNENLNNVHVAVLELNIIAEDTLTALNVLVRRNRELFALESLDSVFDATDGLIARQLEAGDADTIEVLLQPNGIPGTQAMIRGLFTSPPSAAPTLEPITDVVEFGSNGEPGFSAADGTIFLGIFAIDRRAGLVAAQAAGEFRILTGGILQVIADATSAVNLGNTIQKVFNLRIVVPTTLEYMRFVYVNSRNPNDVLPLEAGTDINGTITGDGTHDNPFILNVDKPEQLQVFAVPQQNSDVDLAWVQTGYAFNDNPVDVLYPVAPETWKRAFTRLQRVNILPHPAAPGTPSLRPPRGDEIVLMSGGTPVGDPGVDPGFSNLITLYARGQTVANQDDVKEATIYLIVADPSVL